MLLQTAERVSPDDPSDNYVYQRSILAYTKAAELVSGDVLEIGTGEGYGVSVIAPHADYFLTIDKEPPLSGVIPDNSNVVFKCMTVPPLTGIPSGSMDFVICLQVIEHIPDDFKMMTEIRRVLRKGGKLIVSTPNRLMSLTRNPWHLREYTADELKGLTGCYFSSVEALGVYGNEKVMQYYENNRRSVEKILKYDLLQLNRRLPRRMLRLPYDIMNRINRLRLLHQDENLTTSIDMNDYYLKKADDECFDLFFIATK